MQSHRESTVTEPKMKTEVKTVSNCIAHMVNLKATKRTLNLFTTLSNENVLNMHYNDISRKLCLLLKY